MHSLPLFLYHHDDMRGVKPAIFLRRKNLLLEVTPRAATAQEEMCLGTWQQMQVRAIPVAYAGEVTDDRQRSSS